MFVISLGAREEPVRVQKRSPRHDEAVSSMVAGDANSPRWFQNIVAFLTPRTPFGVGLLGRVDACFLFLQADRKTSLVSWSDTSPRPGRRRVSGVVAHFLFGSGNLAFRYVRQNGVSAASSSSDAKRASRRLSIHPSAVI